MIIAPPSSSSLLRREVMLPQRQTVSGFAARWDFSLLAGKRTVPLDTGHSTWRHVPLLLPFSPYVSVLEHTILIKKAFREWTLTASEEAEKVVVEMLPVVVWTTLSEKEMSSVNDYWTCQAHYLQLFSKLLVPATSNVGNCCCLSSSIWLPFCLHTLPFYWCISISPSLPPELHQSTISL